MSISTSPVRRADTAVCTGIQPSMYLSSTVRMKMCTMVPPDPQSWDLGLPEAHGAKELNTILVLHDLQLVSALGASTRNVHFSSSTNLPFLFTLARRCKLIRLFLEPKFNQFKGKTDYGLSNSISFSLIQTKSVWIAES